jgi:hypothetical protein
VTSTQTHRCAQPDCHRPHHAHGWCNTHYEKWRLLTADKCAVDGCDAGAAVRGWCRRHYRRWARWGDPCAEPPPHRRVSDNLPNPWAAVSPPCPAGHPPLRVYLWHDDGPLRWYCADCQRRFDP